jgi:superfamily II DNA/RNA helicase
LPKCGIFLFSATRLDEKELTFYYNIPSDILKTVTEKKTPFVPKKNVIYNYIHLESDVDKISAACKLLNNTRVRTLILLNSNSKCLLWKDAFIPSFSDRLIAVQSGLSYTERVKAFKAFEENEGNILVTSSNVYWKA